MLQMRGSQTLPFSFLVAPNRWETTVPLFHFRWRGRGGRGRRSLSRRKGRGRNKRLSDPSSSSSSSSSYGGGKVRALFFPSCYFPEKRRRRKPSYFLSRNAKYPLPSLLSPLLFPSQRNGTEFNGFPTQQSLWTLGFPTFFLKKNIRRIHCVDLRWREAQCGRRYLLLLFHCRGITFSCWLFPPPLNVRCESRYFDHGEKEKGRNLFIRGKEKRP